MGGNFLEELVGEWLEFKGYFVRKNVLVGKRELGGYTGELDVVAFRPTDGSLLHYECSTDADSWKNRAQRFQRKFEQGRKYLPVVFIGFQMHSSVRQIALFAYPGKIPNDWIEGIEVIFASDLLQEIVDDVGNRSFLQEAVSQKFHGLRTIQYIAYFIRKGIVTLNAGGSNQRT